MSCVSIIIPVYNTEQYLRQCMDSVVTQTLSDIEIICVNDGSTDNSLDILKEYAQKDGRVVIIDKKNTGYGDSMNTGIERAGGKYIGIVESDDFVDPDMYECLYNVAEKNGVQIIKSNHWTHEEGGEDSFFELFEGYKYDSVIKPREEEMMLCKYVNLWSGIYRKDFLEKNDIRFNTTPGASYQDVGFTLKTMSCADSLYLISDAFYHYRKDNPGSSIHSPEKVYCVCDEFKSVWEFLKKRPEIYEAVKFLIPPIQFLRYRETYNRIRHDYRWNFYLRMKEEFTTLEQQGIFKEECWPKPALESFQTMGVDNYEQFRRWQKLRLGRVGLLVEIRKSKGVYIYGAGKVGKEVFEILQRDDIDILGFIISGTPNEKSKDLCGRRVYGIDEIKNDLNDDIIILVAVKDSDQIFILRKLSVLGITNVISMNREFRSILKELDWWLENPWKKEMEHHIYCDGE